MRGTLAIIGLALATAAGAASLPRVALETTEGRIVIEVDPVHAPISAGNFLSQVDRKLYSGATFYRTVRADNNPRPEFPMVLIQGGIGMGNGKLPPIPMETTAKTGLRHDDGAVSWGRIAPDSATSEFFITIGDAPALDSGPGTRNPDGQGYAVFGHVVSGMDVVRRINARASSGGEAPLKGQMLDKPVAITAIHRVK